MVGFGVSGGISQGRPLYTFTREVVLVLGHPSDWPDCAASANPFPLYSAQASSSIQPERRRSIAMDVHRTFGQIAVVEDGLCRDEGRVGVRPEDLRACAETLQPDDKIALEATTNSHQRNATRHCPNR